VCKKAVDCDGSILGGGGWWVTGLVWSLTGLAQYV